MLANLKPATMRHRDPITAASVQGFSLIELVIAIAILSILFVMASPSLSQASARARMEGAMGEMAMVLQWARSESMRAGVAVVLRTAADGASYSVISNPDTPSAILLKKVDAPSNITFSTSVDVPFESLRGMSASRTVKAASTKTPSDLAIVSDPFGRVRVCSPSNNFTGYPLCD